MPHVFDRPLTAVLALLAGLMVFLLVACAHFPDSMQALAWRDQWGDRGEQVLARDYAMCSELIESKRSLLAGCMAQRGWVVRN